MYNEDLADHILAKLGEAFPRKAQLFELRRQASDYSTLPENDWINAADALVKLGYADGKVLRAGAAQVATAVANLEITAKGRDQLRSSAPAVPPSDDLDVLLPLFSKRQFNIDIATYSAKATELAPLSLMVIDFDYFKEINDQFGHSLADEILISVANELKSVCAHKGRCYRWGGDELAVLLPNYSVGESYALADRVRAAIGGLKFDRYPKRVTLSMGISDYPGVTKAPSALFDDADAAVRNAKESGRDQICVAKGAGLTGVAPVPRLSRAEIKERVDKVRVWLKLLQGVAQNFLIEIENKSREDIIVEEVLVESDGIHLTEPAFAPPGDVWKIRPDSTLRIGWPCKTDPAITLERMHDKGLSFDARIEIVVAAKILGERKEFRQKIPVRVNLLGHRIIPLI